MDLFFQLILNGLIIGTVYSLASVGYALSFSLGINNFAHGSTITLGSFISYLILKNTDLPLAVIFPLVLLAGAVIGWIIYLVTVKPHLNNRFALIAATVGIAVIIDNLVLMSHGPELFSIRAFIPQPRIWQVSGLTITSIQVTLFICSTLIATILFLSLNKTMIGLSYKALADDTEASLAMGFSTLKITRNVMIISGCLATIAGLLISFDYDQDASSGVSLLIKAYTATVIGGTYSIVKVVLAGYLIGIFENIVAGYISSEYALASVFLLLIVLLIFKKEGLGRLGLKREI